MLMTVNDLSKQLHIKPSTLYAWAAQGKIPALKLNGVLRFDRDAIGDGFRVARYPPNGLHDLSKVGTPYPPAP